MIKQEEFLILKLVDKTLYATVCQQSCFLLSISLVYRWPSSPCIFSGFASECLISSSCKDPTPIGLGSTLMTSFYLNSLFKDPVSK